MEIVEEIAVAITTFLIGLAGWKLLQSGGFLGAVAALFGGRFTTLRTGFTSLWTSSTAPKSHEAGSVVPLSVNYHFTRRCNYECGFCYHTDTTGFKLPLEAAYKGILLLKERGMRKFNFSGGEPFFINRGEHLGALVRFCKEEAKLESVSIVSNGSLITETWFKKYGKYVDILAISCDSFVDSTNVTIGRRLRVAPRAAGAGGKPLPTHVEQMLRIAEWCRVHNVLFKINSVINSFNVDEDMSEMILKLKPIRWKLFQCLFIEGENAGEEALRDAAPFWISTEAFHGFVKRHQAKNAMINDILRAEDNETMKDSYLLLDERMRFLNCQKGNKEPTMSILDVGVDAALNDSGFDEEAFLRRGGVYKWSKTQSKEEPSSCASSNELEW